MSRSRKKTPVIKDSPGRITKRIANKRVRSCLKKDTEESLQYKRYRKIYPQYEFRDWWYWGGSFEEYYHYMKKFHNDYPRGGLLPAKKELWKLNMRVRFPSLAPFMRP